MSSISSITSTNNQNGINLMVQDFQAIGSALQSGNLSSAKGAVSNFQTILQSVSQASASSSSQPFGANTKANTDYQNLLASLQSGNLTVAQTAFNSLTTDLLASGPTQTQSAAS